MKIGAAITVSTAGEVVILADRGKEEMDGELAAALGRHAAGAITTRSGPPTSTLYLDRCVGGAACTRAAPGRCCRSHCVAHAVLREVHAWTPPPAPARAAPPRRPLRR